MRGKVTVDGLSLGKVAPKIVLKRIFDLSPGRSGLLLHVEYKGDAWVSVKGIEINLDPTRVFVAGGSGLSGGRRAEVVAPFFCPLTLKLSDLHLCGDVKIEVSHEVVESSASSTGCGSDNNDNNSGSSSSSSSCGTSTFVPDTFTEMFLGKLGLSTSFSSSLSSSTMTTMATTATTRQQQQQQQHQQRRTVIKRKVFVQLMSEEEFIRDFNVESNFIPVPQAVETIKNTIRAATKPLFQKLRSQGMSFQV